MTIFGDTLYMAGAFTQLGGLRRVSLGAVDINTALPTAWNLSGVLFANAVAATMDAIFVAGGFDYIGGQTRNFVALVDPVTGLATDWDPGTFDTYSKELAYAAVSGDHAVASTGYVVFCFDLTRSGAQLWSRSTSSGEGLTISNGVVYLTGSTTASDRRGAIALDIETGEALAWAPNVENSTPSTVAVSGNSVFIGGDLKAARTGGLVRNHLLALDAMTRQLLPWAPSFDSYVYGLCIADGRLYASGAFSNVDGQPRARLAAFDLATGNLLPWDPLAARGNVKEYERVYAPTAVGDAILAFHYPTSRFQFTELISVGRLDSRYQVLDPTERQYQFLAAWTNNAVTNYESISPPYDSIVQIRNLDDDSVINENGSRSISGMCLSGDVLYLAGLSIGGKQGRNLAAYDLVKKTFLPWEPQGSLAYGLALNGDYLYTLRDNLDAIDRLTGEVVTLSEDSSYPLYVSNGWVYCRDASYQLGIYPVMPPKWQFRDLFAAPAVARAGERVVLSFAGEGLTAPPEVTVNGRPAPLAASTSYSAEYVVSDLDPAGPAVIRIDGVDKSGRAVGLTSTSALTITDAPHVPTMSVAGGVALGLALLAAARGARK